MKNASVKRILSISLALLLILSCIPLSAVKAADSRTIYFDNTDNWSVVKIYFWSGSNTGMTAWPGENMTLTSGTIYEYDIPGDAEYVIFNNGSTQTQDISLVADKNLYTYSTGVWGSYVGACEHVWDSGAVVTAATCTTAGVMSYNCTLCGKSKTASIPATGHSFASGVCTTCGAAEPIDQVLYFDNTQNWASVYIYFWSDENDQMTTWPGIAMTLVQGTIYTASLPEDAAYVIFSQNGANQTANLEIPESDNLYSHTAGWSEYDTCAHNWGTATETVAASCLTDGENTYTCSVCGDTKTEVVPAFGHTFVNGSCTTCGAVENCEHNWGEGVVTVEPTCFTFGQRLYTCSSCGETKTESIVPGHNLYVAETIAPTCTATGKEIVKCTNCRYVMDRTLQKVPHDLVAGEKVAPTCTEDGYTVYSCSNCSATVNSDFVYFTGHVWSGNQCTVCGETCEHNYVDGICTNCSAGGPARVDGCYEISNAAELYWFAAQVNAGNNAINGKLIADIDLKNGNWTSIGYYLSDTLEPDTMPYTGTFDGQGHIVSNFTTVGTDNEGLFGYCSSATILNVGVVNATVTGWRAGAVAGYALTSNVSNCFAVNCTIIGKTTNSVALNSGTVYIAPVISPQGGICNNSYAVNCTLVDNTDLEVYTSPVGGTDCQNGYYCNITYAEDFSSVRNSTEVTTEQLASGEVTYLLNKGVTDGTQGWYQTCGTGMPAHSGATVYKVTDCGADTATYTNDPNVSGNHNYQGSVTKQPTCTETGVMTYTCTGCGDSYTESIDVSDHSYEGGKCTVCGAADPNYTAPSITASNVSLSFEDEILLNVYFTTANMGEAIEYGLLIFGQQVADPSTENADTINPGSYSNGDLRAVTTPGIPAKKLGDTVYFAVYARLADGSYVYSKCYHYSPYSYAYSMLNKSTTSADMKSLIVAMLNYGAAAQTYFGYNTGALVNASLTDEQKALVVDYNADMLDGLTVCAADKKGELFGNGNTGFTKRTPSVNFEGAFSVNFYFSQPKATVGSDVTFYVWDKATYESVDTLLPENAVATSTCTFAGTYYMGMVEGIAAKEVDETFYCAAVFTGEDGNTYVSGVIAYSLGYYLENQANGTAMPEFAQTTGVYAYYAKTVLA